MDVAAGMRAPWGLVLRRTYSVPERVSLFAVGAGAAGTVYPAVMGYTHGQGLPCPLLTLTGVPCPFCGMTTATVALVHGDWAAAAAASPLAYLAALLAVVTMPVLVARATGLAASPRPWSAATRRRTAWVTGFVVALSWIFQLHRFGFW
jgi:hypothetical protein